MSLVKDAHDFVVAEVDKLFSVYGDLSVAGLRPANRLDRVDDGCLVV
jgi:hypothetical protein